MRQQQQQNTDPKMSRLSFRFKEKWFITKRVTRKVNAVLNGNWSSTNCTTMIENKESMTCLSIVAENIWWKRTSLTIALMLVFSLLSFLYTSNDSYLFFVSSSLVSHFKAPIQWLLLSFSRFYSFYSCFLPFPLKCAYSNTIDNEKMHSRNLL